MSMLLMIALLAGEAGLAEETSTARVCFVRHDDGKMNIVPVQIYGFRAEHRQLLTTLAGGVEACVDVEPGDWSFEARSNGPQARRKGKARSCRSNPFMTGAVAGTTTTIEVSPNSKGTAKVCGWRLRREADAHPGVESIRPSRRR